MGLLDKHPRFLSLRLWPLDITVMDYVEAAFCLRGAEIGWIISVKPANALSR